MRDDGPDVVFTRQGGKERALIERDRRRSTRRGGRSWWAPSASRNPRSWPRPSKRRGVACEVLNAHNDELEAAIVAGAGAPGAVTISTNMAGRGTDIGLGGGDRRRDETSGSALGGLYVIGTNRHESRRIDDQLRGRAGRQGDPGSSRFFISLEDDLIRRYGVMELIPRSHRPGPQETAVDDPARAPRDRPRAADHRGPELRDPEDAVELLGDG